MLQPKVTIFKGKKPQPSGTVIAATSSGVDYTPAHDEKIKKRAASGFKDTGVEGISVDKSGQATANPFSRKVVVSQGGHTRIYGDDNKLIKEGEGHTKDIRDAVRASEKKADLTNEQRQRNARASDLVNQTATNIRRSEVNDLAKAKLATADRLGEDDTPANITARAKEAEIRQLTETRKAKEKTDKEAALKKDLAKTEAFRVRISKKK